MNAKMPLIIYMIIYIIYMIIVEVILVIICKIQVLSNISYIFFW